MNSSYLLKNLAKYFNNNNQACKIHKEIWNPSKIYPIKLFK